MQTLMGQPIETWIHVVETELMERDGREPGERLMPILLAFHEALKVLKKRERDQPADPKGTA
jgi:hypothetical protein